MDYKKQCRICNRDYDFCYTCEETYSKTMFAWRVVCCSTECAKIYFAQIELENNKEQEDSFLDINKNIKIDGGKNMQILLNDNKTYMVEGIDTKKNVIKLKDVEKEVKIEEIKEFLYISQDNILALSEIIKNSKKVEKIEEKE